jgi:hypothetical protein
VNPLTKARDGATAAWSKSRDGTRRTATWIKDGTTGTAGKVRDRTSTATGGARDGIEAAWDRVGGGALVHRAKQDNRMGAALILGAILLVTWIAWTIYVWTENGSTAGLGVLISWPAVLTALALVAAPFVAAALLVRRLAADREPALAGGVPATVEAEPVKSESAEDEDDAEDEDEDEESGDDEDEESGDDEDDDSEDESDDDEDSQAA